MRRACRARDLNLNSVIVDLGCVTDDEKIIDVGTQTTWQDKSDPSTVYSAFYLIFDEGGIGELILLKPITREYNNVLLVVKY